MRAILILTLHCLLPGLMSRGARGQSGKGRIGPYPPDGG
jgi:hypothetical protein